MDIIIIVSALPFCTQTAQILAPTAKYRSNVIYYMLQECYRGPYYRINIKNVYRAVTALPDGNR